MEINLWRSVMPTDNPIISVCGRRAPHQIVDDINGTGGFKNQNSVLLEAEVT